MTRITVTSYEDVSTFIISRWILHIMGNISHTICSENQNTYFMFSNFFPENHAVYEIMWKNMVEADRLLITIWHMGFAC